MKANYLVGCFNKALTYVKEQMYSEETTQESPNLTVEEFNDIMKEGTALFRELLKYPN